MKLLASRDDCLLQIVQWVFVYGMWDVVVSVINSDRVNPMACQWILRPFNTYVKGITIIISLGHYYYIFLSHGGLKE